MTIEPWKNVQTQKVKIMTIDFFDVGGGEISVHTEFPQNPSVNDGEIYKLIGQGINGMLLMAQKIGKAKGLTNKQVEEAIFGKIK